VKRQLTQANSAALDEFCAEVAEASAKLERLEEKLRDIETENAETMASIEMSQRTLHIQKNSTQAEAFRLKGTLLSRRGLFDAQLPDLHSCPDELATLEQLHLWHTARGNRDLFDMIYASRFRVHIPCANFKPLKNQIRIERTKEMVFKQKDQFPRFTDLCIQVAQQRIASSPPKLGIKQVMIVCLSFLIPPPVQGGAGVESCEG
jgi:hypothetical protein